MKAYIIVDNDNPISVAYAKISRKSYQPAIDNGTISEIIDFPAITPNHPEFDSIVAKYNFCQSMMNGDVNNKQPEDHSPTEKAGMCSHWELMRMQGEDDERFLVLEHDSYLIEEHIDEFCALIDYINFHGTLYANIGLFMGCYTFEQHCAAWQYELLTKGKFPINSGPYGTLERLFKTYTTNYLSKVNFRGILNTVIHPWHSCDTLGVGRDIFSYFNTKDNRPRMSIPNPTTQVISKSLLVTQDHHGYSDKSIQEPWTRHKYFKVIE